MDYRDYMKRIKDKIGEAKAADRIEEGSRLRKNYLPSKDNVLETC